MGPNHDDGMAVPILLILLVFFVATCAVIMAVGDRGPANPSHYDQPPPAALMTKP